MTQLQGQQGLKLTNVELILKNTQVLLHLPRAEPIYTHLFCDFVQTHTQTTPFLLPRPLTFHALFRIAWLADGDSVMCSTVMMGWQIAKMFSTFPL